MRGALLDQVHTHVDELVTPSQPARSSASGHLEALFRHRPGQITRHRREGNRRGPREGGRNSLGLLTCARLPGWLSVVATLLPDTHQKSCQIPVVHGHSLPRPAPCPVARRGTRPKPLHRLESLQLLRPLDATLRVGNHPEPTCWMESLLRCSENKRFPLARWEEVTLFVVRTPYRLQIFHRCWC